MKSGTVREHLDANNGSAPGFDALRLILSVAILLWHTVYVCYGRFSETYDLVWTHPLIAPLLRGMLPMFFFLGGFLVTASAYRLRAVKPFLMFRVLRIVPALLVEVTLSAIVLGAFLTQLPLQQYYTHPGFFAYFLNIIGLIRYTLPGVFQDNPVPTTDVVNVNLWTLPPDFEGYAIMAILILTGCVFDRKTFLSVFILGSLVLFAMLPFSMDWGNSGTVYIHPRLLIYSFFVGAFCFVFADRIRISTWLMALSVLTLPFFWFKYTIILGVFGICYLTLCLGFLDLRNFPLVKRGDYSYGIYLYGFPIERTLFHYLPALQEWWQLFLVALPVTLIFAVLSWHLIEKPFLKLKKKFGRPSPHQQ